MSITKTTLASLEHEGHTSSDSDNKGMAFTDFDAEYHSMLCCGCSCLCDDISYYLQKGQVTRTLNLCEAGWKRISSISSPGLLPPPPPPQGKEDIQRAAELLRSHSPSLIIGADHLDEASLKTSLQLAQALRGIWLPSIFPAVRRFYKCVKSHGWATALLDEVRDQADLVLFWRVDPLETHHRHLSRYSVFARGRSTERGHHDRNLAAISHDRTPIEPLCQQFFTISPDRDPDFIEALISPAKDFDHQDFPLLERALQGATYVAIFVDPEKTGEAALDALFRWSAKVNSEGHQRLVIMPLWNAGSNIEGFCRISLENNTAPWGADFSGNSSESTFPETDWEKLAARVKSVLLFGSEPVSPHHRDFPASLAEKPLAVIDPFKQSPAQQPDVLIPAALPGIESDGVFFREDGLPLSARRMGPLASSGYPSVTHVLNEITTEVQ